MYLIKMIINQAETHTAKFHIHTSSSESLWHPRKRYIRRRALFQNGGGHTPHHTRHKTIPRHRPVQFFFHDDVYCPCIFFQLLFYDSYVFSFVGIFWWIMSLLLAKFYSPISLNEATLQTKATQLLQTSKTLLQEI